MGLVVLSSLYVALESLLHTTMRGSNNQTRPGSLSSDISRYDLLHLGHVRVLSRGLERARGRDHGREPLLVQIQELVP